MKTKELNEKAFNYILNAIDSSEYGGEELATEKEKLQFLFDTFKSECLPPDNFKRYWTVQNYFKEWIQGMPSCFNIAFYNYDIINLAKSWGSIPPNAAEKQEAKIINNYFNFITVKTFQLFRKYKISIN